MSVKYCRKTLDDTDCRSQDTGRAWQNARSDWAPLAQRRVSRALSRVSRLHLSQG